MPETPTLTDGAFLDWLAGDDPDDPSMGGILEALAPLIARMVAEAEQGGRAEVSAALEAPITRANAMRPEDFPDQPHLAPAFRGINYKAAFLALAEVFNDLERRLADPAAAVARIKAEALREARDALYCGEGPDLVADSDIMYGEWLGNRADRIAGVLMRERGDENDAPLPCCLGRGPCQAPPDIGPCDPLPTTEKDAPACTCLRVPRVASLDGRDGWIHVVGDCPQHGRNLRGPVAAPAE